MARVVRIKCWEFYDGDRSIGYAIKRPGGGLDVYYARGPEAQDWDADELCTVGSNIETVDEARNLVERHARENPEVTKWKVRRKAANILEKTAR